jgi:hypothetical protein
MAFDLSRPATLIHQEFAVAVEDEEWRIMGVFKRLPTNKATDEFIRSLRTLQDQFEADSSFGLFSRVQEMASSVFHGWVNPAGREDLWVTSGGVAVESTDENRAHFLSVPGVALAVCQEYASAIGSRKAALGNSEPSPASGSPPIESQPSPTS